MKITIAGTGYVGLVTGVCLASVGHDVTCIDINSRKIEMLKRGESPIFENDLEALIRKSAAHLRFTTDPREAYAEADVLMISVGTPEKPDGSCELTFVYSVADDIIEFSESEPVVVMKSTVPIGTCEKVQHYINTRIRNGHKIRIASNPEFLSQGTAVHDTLYASRVVIGASDESTLQVMRQMYEPFHLPIVETDLRTAEMIKYASNNFLALKISYINEIASLCEAIGADVTDVARGMGLDPRIGGMFLRAGIGYGGSCFPKDTKALYWLGESSGRPLKTVRAAIDVNEEQKILLLEKARAFYPSLRGRCAAVLGLSFKPGTDDIREAPSLRIVPALLEEGARVYVWDPAAERNFSKVYPEHVEYCKTPEEALRDADLCLILTEWEEIRAMTAEEFVRLMRTPLIIDGRNCFALQTFAGTPVQYISIGRKAVLPADGKEGNEDEQ